MHFIVSKNLRHVTLAGHSMGISVVCAYLEEYGNDRVSKLIFVDQMPMITSGTSWTAKEKQGRRRDPGSRGT